MALPHRLLRTLIDLPRRPERWIALFLMARGVGLIQALALLLLHPYEGPRGMLALIALSYTVGSMELVRQHPAVFRLRACWAADIAVMLCLVVASDDWRSPFYLLALTSLAAPTTVLPFRQALAVGGSFTAMYGAAALYTGPKPDQIAGNLWVLEPLLTHLTLPGVIALGLAYAADVVRRLDDERLRSERLAIETERRRIAWELHDSAKQRLHAANLMLSSIVGQLEPAQESMLGAAMEQVSGATADMQTSIAELRSPLEGRPLEEALTARAQELGQLGTISFRVEGRAPALPALSAAHAYRILAEAMSNAVRHSGAARVLVRLGTGKDGGLIAQVLDDGHGMPQTIRPGANGLLTMSSRAYAIGGRVNIHAGRPCGTVVDLEVPPGSSATAVTRSTQEDARTPIAGEAPPAAAARGGAVPTDPADRPQEAIA